MALPSVPVIIIGDSRAIGVIELLRELISPCSALSATERCAIH